MRGSNRTKDANSQYVPAHMQIACNGQSKEFISSQDFCASEPFNQRSGHCAESLAQLTAGTHVADAFLSAHIGIYLSLSKVNHVTFAPSNTFSATSYVPARTES